MKLFLCEKHLQAIDISKVLGNPREQQGYIVTDGGTVTWASGHLFEMENPEAYGDQYKRWAIESLPIVPKQWKIRIKSKCKAQFSVIKNLLSKTSELLIATDSDREGELIAREILIACNYQGNIKRLWFKSMGKTSLQKALNSLKPDEETKPFYFEALARARADWLVGMNLTRLMSVKFGSPGSSLSVGRVQTPTAALVVWRDREIENFKIREFFDLVADVKVGDHTLTMQFQPAESDNRIWNRIEAEKIAVAVKGKTSVLKVNKEEKKTGPPKLFTLSSLQKKCNSFWGWSAKKTLSIAQSLYETHKVITYPRTDSPYLPDEQREDVPIILKNLVEVGFDKAKIINPEFRTSVWKMQKGAAHDAITPTLDKPLLDKLSDDERKAFDIIAKYYIAAFMPDYRCSFTEIILVVDGMKWRVASSVPVEFGWKEILQVNETEDSPNNNLPDIVDGSEGNIVSVKIEPKKTQPPSSYNEGDLITDMMMVGKFVTDPVKKERLKESKGIGTEATRASIIEKLKDIGFLEAKGRKIISTSKARNFIGMLEKYLPDVVDPGETAIWEEFLASISNGQNTCEEFLARIERRVREQIEQVAKLKKEIIMTETNVICPKSNEPVQDAGTYWKFNGYEGCYFYKEAFGRKFSAEDYVRILSAPEGEAFDNLKNKENKTYSARLKFNPDRVYKDKPSPGIDLVFENKPQSEIELAVMCPISNKPAIDRGKFYEFPGLPGGCFWKTSFGREMKPEDYVSILNAAGEPVELYDCVSKAGKPYTAKVRLNRDRTYNGKPSPALELVL